MSYCIGVQQCFLIVHSIVDHSRIKLQQDDNDYINASLIKMEEAHRSYILTQVTVWWGEEEEVEIDLLSFLSFSFSVFELIRP